MAQAAVRPWVWLDGIFAAALRRPFIRRIGRDTAFIVPVCIILIFGSFAACAFLQIRLDNAHAVAQAALFQQTRALDLARATAASLDRYARMGAVFAASPEQYRSAELGRAEPTIEDIAVWDGAGRQLARLDALAGKALAEPMFGGDRTVFGGGLAFRQKGRVVEVLFDPNKLALPGAELVAADRSPGERDVPGWPLAVRVRSDDRQALRSWIGALPLYLFVILGPALAGAWLAALFVSTFERQAKAARAIKSLKSTRPMEATLMVRLANAERAALEARRSKSEFIAHMSHELRTPLNAVIGFSEIIADDLYGPGHPKYREYARDIVVAGRNLHGKIGDILEFASIEAGHHPLKVEALELASLVRACVDEHQGRAFSRRISLSLAFGEPGLVRADPHALRRILSNLLTNSLTYTAEGGIVRADVHFEEGAGILTLSDSGAGFTPREAQQAGEPFERFDRAGTVTGQGLGLAIAVELSRRMGGAMQLQGGQGQGAIMELRLPRL